LLDQLDHDLEQAKMGSGRIGTALVTLKTAMEKVRPYATLAGQQLTQWIP
jgi:hypothetical protein